MFKSRAEEPAVKDRWSEGVANEIEFWGQVISGTGPNGHYHSDILSRLDPRAQVQAYLAPHLPTDRPARVLDIASGPVTNLGWMHGDVPMDVVAVDALADPYNALLDQHGFNPPARTRAGDGETIGEMFDEGTFDAVHIRNGLDHCYEPLRVLENALKVVRSGGVVMVVGFLNEAEFESYIGLHQWNVDVDGVDIVVWRPGERHSVQQAFEGRAKVSATAYPDRRYMTAVIKKL